MIFALGLPLKLTATSHLPGCAIPKGNKQSSSKHPFLGVLAASLGRVIVHEVWVGFMTWNWNWKLVTSYRALILLHPKNNEYCEMAEGLEKTMLTLPWNISGDNR